MSTTNGHTTDNDYTDDTGYTEPIDQIRTIFRAVETLLSADAPVAVQLSDLEQISEAERRNLLLRATIAAPPQHLPRSLIVKKVIADPYAPDDIENWNTMRFFRDWAGVALLSHCAPEAAHAPHFYGGDREIGFVLLEDMGEQHGSLVQPLLGPDLDQGEAALLHFVERLAQMHVDTYGRAAEYYQIVATLNPQLAYKLQHEKEFGPKVTNVTSQLAQFDIALTPQTTAELSTLTTIAGNPGPFTAYCHGDPCPDNFFWQGTKLRIMDFEFGHMGHALSDLAFGRMTFPTCWCSNRLPASFIEIMENRYRAIFAQAYPAILDDRVFGRAMTEICGITLIASLDWLLETALKEDHEWGLTTLRPRLLARLEAFIATSEEFDHLPHLRMLAEQLLQQLQQRWADATPLPLYPAFRG